jgi:hypothetical protein
MKLRELFGYAQQIAHKRGLHRLSLSRYALNANSDAAVALGAEW